MTEKEQKNENRLKISNHKWVQGSTVPLRKYNAEALAHDRIAEELINDNDKEYFLLVISQSCDVINGDLDNEPNIECLVLEEITNCQNDYKNGKNARILHINYRDKSYEIRPKYVYFLPKSVAINTQCENVLCSHDNMHSNVWQTFIKTLRDFRVARYARTATPNAFDDKTRKLFEDKKFKKELEKIQSQVDKLYIRLTPWKDSDKYKVGIIALVNKETKNEDIENIEELIYKKLLDPLSELEDIEVENGTDEWDEEELATMMTKDAFSIGLLDTFAPYNYDHISIKQTLQDSRTVAG